MLIDSITAVLLTGLFNAVLGAFLGGSVASLLAYSVMNQVTGPGSKLSEKIMSGFKSLDKGIIWTGIVLLVLLNLFVTVLVKQGAEALPSFLAAAGAGTAAGFVVCAVVALPFILVSLGLRVTGVVKKQKSLADIAKAWSLKEDSPMWFQRARVLEFVSRTSTSGSDAVFAAYMYCNVHYGTPLPFVPEALHGVYSWQQAYTLYRLPEFRKAGYKDLPPRELVKNFLQQFADKVKLQAPDACELHDKTFNSQERSASLEVRMTLFLSDLSNSEEETRTFVQFIFAPRRKNVTLPSPAVFQVLKNSVFPLEFWRDKDLREHVAKYIEKPGRIL